MPKLLIRIHVDFMVDGQLQPLSPEFQARLVVLEMGARMLAFAPAFVLPCGPVEWILGCEWRERAFIVSV